MPAAAAKKKCKVVVKQIHGHKRKVRVCPKPKPKPVKNVSLTLDSSRSVSRPITAAEGGTVTATSAAGAKLTLTVPKDALVADTTVRLTPVASVAGLPPGARLIGGIQFEPEGTPLGRGATLSVESSRLGAAKHLHAVVWFGRGRYVSLWPGKREGTAFRLPLAHFSGAAVYDGSGSGLLDAQGTSRPYYEQVVRPKLQQALTNDAVAQEAIQLWVDWERGMQLAGVGDDYLAPQRAEAASLVPKIIRNVLKKTFERCVNQHDVVKEVQKMIQIGRAAALAGAQADTGSLLDEAFDKAERCARFELDFETVLTVTNAGSKQEETANVTWNTTEVIHVAAQALPLVPSAGATEVSFPPVAKGLEVREFGYDDYHHSEARSGDTDTCTSTAHSASAVEPFQVFRLELSGKETPELTLEMLPGDIQSVANGSCSWTTLFLGSGSYPVSTPLNTLLSSLFTTLHSSEYRGQGFLISDWTYLGSSVWARKTYERTVAATETSTVTERTSFDLRHTPLS